MRAVAALSQLRIVTAAAFIAFLVASCDGGDGNTVRQTIPPLSDQSPAGIYTGVFQPSSNAQARVATGIVSEDSEIHLAVQSASGDTQLAGFVSVDGDVLSGTLTEYLGASARWFGSDGVRSIALDGIVSQRDALYGDYSGDDDGAFRLDYNALYERSSSPAQTFGVWTFDLASSGGGVYNVTLDIGPMGELFGADTDGCIYTGEVATVDSNINAYSVRVTVSSCDPYDGDYTGFAFRDDLAGGAVLYLLFANDRYAFSTIFTR